MDVLKRIENGEYKLSNATGTSHVWKYYTKIEDTKSGELVPYVICPKCEKIFKFAKGASSSNLKKHSCYKRLIRKGGSPTKEKRDFRQEFNKSDPEEDSDSSVTKKPILTNKRDESREEEEKESGPVLMKQELPELNETIREEESITEEILQKIENGEYLMSYASGSSHVWKYFQKIEVKKTGETVPYVICTECKRLFKFGKAYSSSNLKKHTCYKKHLTTGKFSTTTPVKRKLVEEDDDPSFITNRALSVINDPLREEVNCWTTTKRIHFNISEQIREDVLQGCMKFSCFDLRPLDIINGEGFKDLARCLVDVGAQVESHNFSIDDILPQPSTISQRLQQLHHNEREKFVNVIRPFIEKGMCATTVNILADIIEQRKFITFTVHFIDNNWQLQSRILFTTEFEYCDDNEIASEENPRNIINAIECKFEELNLDGNLFKNITFTTGSNTNIKKALKHYSKLNNCLSNILNNILEHAFDKEILEYDAPDVMELIKKSQYIMANLKQMGRFEIFESTTKQETPTRWNPKFEMLWCFSKQLKVIEDIFKKSEQTHRINQFEKQMLDKLMNILEPFKNLLVVLENKKNPTIHLVLLHMHILKAKLLKLQNSESNNEIKTILTNCLDNFIDEKFRPDKIHKIAAFLWPQYKQMRYLSESERDEVYDLVKAELLKISQATFSAISTQDTETEHLYGAKNFDADDLLSQYKDINTQVTNVNSESQICIQMEMYKNSCFVENNIWNWWRGHGDGFPLMAKLARKILCIPASSAASGNCFSLTKRVLEQRLTNLIGENMDAILFLHSHQNNQSIF